MIYAGGEFNDLVMAGSFVVMSTLSLIVSIYAFFMAYRRIKRGTYDDTTFLLLGMSLMTFGYWLGDGMLALWTIGYAHSDWGLLNAATRIGSGALGLTAAFVVLAGFTLMLSPVIRHIPGVGARWPHVSMLTLALLLCVGIVFAHSGHMQARWAANKIDAFNIAITPDFIRDSNVKRMADSDLE